MIIVAVALRMMLQHESRLGERYRYEHISAHGLVTTLNFLIFDIS